MGAKSKKGRKSREIVRVGCCPFCGSENVYYRKTMDDFRCRKCSGEFVPHM